MNKTREERALEMKIVVKIGSNVLTNRNGGLSYQTVGRLAREIGRLRNETGNQFVLVTSGAVSTGRGIKHLTGTDTETKQYLASVGQPILMACYLRAFEKSDALCSQVLVTSSDFQDEARKLMLRGTIERNFAEDTIPIVNENDALSAEELLNAFTDNDQLAALIAMLIGADKMIVLSDVDGFYNGSPTDAKSKVVPVIRDIDAYIGMIDPNVGNGRGGMLSKLMTAKTVTSHGVDMYIANGNKKDITTSILQGLQVGTFFPSRN